MMEKVNGEWKPFTHKVIFVDKNGEQEVYTSDVAWYNRFAMVHDDFEILDIEEVEYSYGQMQRLEEIKYITNISDTVANDYILDGTFGDGLKELEGKKRLEQAIADLDYLSIMAGVDLNV